MLNAFAASLMAAASALIDVKNMAQAHGADLLNRFLLAEGEGNKGKEGIRLPVMWFSLLLRIFFR